MLHVTMKFQFSVMSMACFKYVVYFCLLTHSRPINVYQEGLLRIKEFSHFNTLSANPTKWTNTPKQFVGKLPTNCLDVFDHFVGLALKGLTSFFLLPRKIKGLIFKRIISSFLALSPKFEMSATNCWKYLLTATTFSQKLFIETGDLVNSEKQIVIFIATIQKQLMIDVAGNNEFGNYPKMEFLLFFSLLTMRFPKFYLLTVFRTSLGSCC